MSTPVSAQRTFEQFPGDISNSWIVGIFSAAKHTALLPEEPPLLPGAPLR